MKKKNLIKIIASSVCGLAVATAIPVSLTSCNDKDTFPYSFDQNKIQYDISDHIEKGENNTWTYKEDTKISLLFWGKKVADISTDIIKANLKFDYDHEEEISFQPKIGDDFIFEATPYKEGDDTEVNITLKFLEFIVPDSQLNAKEWDVYVNFWFEKDKESESGKEQLTKIHTIEFIAKNPEYIPPA